MDVNADDYVVSPQRQRRVNPTTLDPTGGTLNRATGSDFIVDVQARLEVRDTLILLKQARAALEDAAVHAEVEELAVFEQLHVEWDGRERAKKLAQHRSRPLRSALVGGLDVMFRTGFTPHSAADFAIEIESLLQDGLSASAGKDQPSLSIRLSPKEPQKPDRRGRIEVHDADVEAGLTIGIDGRVLLLLGNGGLLQV